MIIQLLNEFKSLQPFVSEDLNDLTIIIGKNGSGKSQLLKLIGSKVGGDGTPKMVKIAPNIKRIQYEGIIKEKKLTIRYEDWKKTINQSIENFFLLKSSTKHLIDFILENSIDFSKPTESILTTEEKYLRLIRRSASELSLLNSSNQTNDLLIQNQLIGIFRDSFHIKKAIQLSEEICKTTGKKLSEVTREDFYSNPIPESFIDKTDLFTSDIEVVFYNYAKRRDQNKRNYFEKKEEKVENNSISDSEFISRFPPPWKTINEILENHKIDFYFKDIRKYVQEVPAHVLLVKRSTNKEISFTEISDGEKVIIGLILKLFTSEYYGNTLSLPDLLIMDEPDAPLHPEMSKLLIDVLEETFVKKLGIKVIFSTHSPSTIALAPEPSIYELKNGNDTSLKKVNKDYALNLLTNFIPTLSIDYKNHRQVYVESPTDVEYYQTLYDKLSQNKKLDHKLYFISNAMGKGNSDLVYNLVHSIRKTGNITSYGIVDWDLKNKSESFVYVHGENERYSVENFILDPIYLVTLLIKLKDAHNICEKTGLSKLENEYLLGTKSNEELQRTSDTIFKEIETKFPVTGKKELRQVEYLNGKKIKIPDWFLNERGHNLVDKLKEVFAAFNKFKNEGELQSELIPIMAKSYPFVPLSSINIIEKIAAH